MMRYGTIIQADAQEAPRNHAREQEQRIPLNIPHEMRKDPRKDHHHQDRVEQRPDEAQDRPLIPDAQLLHDHVLHDGPEPHELAMVLAQPLDPPDGPTRSRRRRKELRVREFGGRSDFHAYGIPILAATPDRPSPRVHPRRPGILRASLTLRKINTARSAQPSFPKFARFPCWQGRLEAITTTKRSPRCGSGPGWHITGYFPPSTT